MSLFNNSTVRHLDLIVFITADVGSLVIQSLGGAKAATAAKSNHSADEGGRIMVGGIIFQLGECLHATPRSTT